MWLEFRRCSSDLSVLLCKLLDSSRLDVVIYLLLMSIFERSIGKSVLSLMGLMRTDPFLLGLEKNYQDFFVCFCCKFVGKDNFSRKTAQRARNIWKKSREKMVWSQSETNILLLLGPEGSNFLTFLVRKMKSSILSKCVCFTVNHDDYWCLFHVWATFSKKEVLKIITENSNFLCDSDGGVRTKKIFGFSSRESCTSSGFCGDFLFSIWSCPFRVNSIFFGMILQVI